MKKSDIVDRLQVSHNAYFGLLMKNYPNGHLRDQPFDLGPPELCELATEVQSSAIALGPKALARLNHIGLSVLYAFDNPVDLYNWKREVIETGIDRSTYASIAVRIDQELKRLKQLIELGGENSYEQMPDDLFLVSHHRYASAANSPAGNRMASEETPSIQIGTLNIGHAVDAPAISRLQELEAKSTIYSNTFNVVSALRALVWN